MRVAFTYNIRHTGAGFDAASQAEAEFDDPATIAAIHDAIEANGHACVDVEADDEAYPRLLDLRSSIDLVFNIAEGRTGDSREAQVPSMLEMLGIAFSHSGSLTQAISLDKALTKKVWRYHGLPTPRFVLFGPGLEQETVEAIRFPVLVKPNAEGSSKGLFDGNLVEHPFDLLDKVAEIHALIGGKVLAEEYLDGREFTVTVLGNPGIGEGLLCLPIVEQNYDRFPPDLHHFASYEAKWFFEDSEVGLEAVTCPADLAPALRAAVEDLAKRAFVSLGCRDVARVDIRLDRDGEPQLLEINPMPGMYHDPLSVSYFPVAARAAGWDYPTMIGQVLDRTIGRVRAMHTARVAAVDEQVPSVGP